jgi:hypothetical protein
MMHGDEAQAALNRFIRPNALPDRAKPRRTFGIDMSEELIERASAKAERLGKSRSEYGRELVRRDLAWERPISPGQFASLFFRSKIERDKAATDELLIRTVAETGTGETAQFPLNVIADLIKFVDPARPVTMISRGGRGPGEMALAGKQFIRPRLTSATTAALQTEKAQASSTQVTTVADTFTKGRYARTLNLTEQDIDWSDDAWFDLVIEELAEGYAVITESVAAGAVVSGATNTTPCTDFDNPSVVLAAVVAGITTVRTNSKRMPDVLLVSGNRWDSLAGMTGSDDLPVFPRLATEGPAGLQVIYSPGFAADQMIVAASRYIETYETPKGIVASVPVANATPPGAVPIPSSLERALCYRGDFVANALPQGLCALVAA